MGLKWDVICRELLIISHSFSTALFYLVYSQLVRQLFCKWLKCNLNTLSKIAGKLFWVNATFALIKNIWYICYWNLWILFGGLLQNFAMISHAWKSTGNMKKEEKSMWYLKCHDLPHPRADYNDQILKILKIMVEDLSQMRFYIKGY